MENVKYITEKSRPNLFRVVSGGLKTPITLLLTLFVVINGFAQQYIDIVNAPLNPIGYIENRNQLNLKGDIAFYNAGNDGYLYFDKNGNRLFNILHTYTDKEKARINKGTYLELDNQKKVIYKENYYFDDKTFYTYNPNGTISKIEVQGKYPSVTTFEYDNKKRLNKKIEQKDAKTTATTYTYQTIGNRIVISASETVTENNQSKSRTEQYTFENGLPMKYISDDGLTDNYKYTFDDKGNQLTRSYRFGTANREFYYHSELEQWDKWSWKYVKNYVWLPYLTVGNREVYSLIYSSKDLDDFTDVLFYEPITSTTLVAENVVTTNGLSQGTGGGKISTLKAKNFTYTSVKGNIMVFVEGYNKSGNHKLVFTGNTYVIYDANSSLTYWCRDFEKGKKFNVFEDLGKDALLWYKNEKNDVYLWQKGDYVSTSGYTLGETLNDGSKLLYKNQKPNLVLENFTSSKPNTLYKAVPYSGQAIPKTTTTTAGANTAVKDYSKDKITASYNENESLYARKIDNATVYFYQNNKRINQPLHYAIIENDNNLRLFTTYTKDYYSAFALNDMLPEKLYPLTHRNGVFYLYINQSNGNFSFNYQGKALSSAQYELYKSKGDYTVVKVKSDNTIYLFKSDLTKAAISNSQSKGVLVHFADKSSIFVESGKPTEPTKWKIEKENDKYYLFNSSGSIKYSLSDYEKSINWGIYTIH